jgi:hypothetical protein
VRLVFFVLFFVAMACALKPTPIADKPSEPPPRIMEFTFPLAFPGATQVCVEVVKPVMFSTRCISLAELRAILTGHKL